VQNAEICTNTLRPKTVDTFLPQDPKITVLPRCSQLRSGTLMTMPQGLGDRASACAVAVAVESPRCHEDKVQQVKDGINGGDAKWIEREGEEWRCRGRLYQKGPRDGSREREQHRNKTNIMTRWKK